MKFNRVLCFFLLLALPVLSFGADDGDALFEKGNTAYNKAQYAEALKTYQVLVNDGYQSAALYFNIGNAYYKTGDVPSALLYYEKAHKLSPGDDDINFNIRFVNLKTTDKIDEAPEFFLTKWWGAFVMGISLGALSAISILAVLLGSALLIVYFFAAGISIKKTSFYAAIILFCIGVSAFFIAGRQTSYFENHKAAIIFSSSVTVKSGPVDKASTLFVLHDGTKVNVLDSTNGWINIRLVNGNEGWIKLSDVKEI